MGPVGCFALILCDMFKRAIIYSAQFWHSKKFVRLLKKIKKAKARSTRCIPHVFFLVLSGLKYQKKYMRNRTSGTEPTFSCIFALYFKIHENVGVLYFPCIFLITACLLVRRYPWLRNTWIQKKIHGSNKSEIENHCIRYFFFGSMYFWKKGLLRTKYAWLKKNTWKNTWRIHEKYNEWNGP